MENHKQLSNFLKYLTKHFSVYICINDFVGFIPLDKELYTVLKSYVSHRNPYCRYIKTDKKLWEKCKDMKSKIYNKCIRKQKYFYGVCYAGVGELIYPIFYGKQLLGVINVGVFAADCSRKLIERVCRSSKIDKDEAVKLYEENMKDRFTLDREEELHINFEFVCNYLSNCFSKLSAGYPVSFHMQNKYRYNENLSLSDCIQYIRTNYRNSIDVALLRKLCHCSESYINHLFKKRTGKGVKSYINDLRIEEAKKLLLDTSESISSIALVVGFQDSDYFSRVFSKVTGISPRKYRTIHNVKQTL